MSFAEILKSMRKRRGLTQEHCAMHLGISVPTLISWEKDHVLPPRVTQRGAWLILRGIPTCDPADAVLDEKMPPLFEDVVEVEAEAEQK
jgi:transcriptional regulator with XRE-family HTH domain